MKKNIMRNTMNWATVIVSCFVMGFLVYFWGTVFYDTFFNGYRYSGSILEWTTTVWLTILNVKFMAEKAKDIIKRIKSTKGKRVAA